MMKWVGWISVLWGVMGTVCTAIEVVTSTPTLAYFASVIGGDRVTVSSLSSGKEDPHGIMTKPSMMGKVRQADVVVVIGMECDPWLTELAKRMGKRTVQPGGIGYLDMSNTPIQRLGVMDAEAMAALKGYEHVHPEGNPHYWLLIDNAQVMAKAMRHTLSKVDPDGAPGYAMRHQRLETRLTQLKERLKKEGSGLQGRPYWVIHDAWSYLLANVGGSVAGSVEEAPGISPGPLYFKRRLDDIKRKKGGVLLVDQYGGSRHDGYVKKISEAGCPVAYVTQSITPDTPTYEALIEQNIQRIQAAVRNTP